MTSGCQSCAVIDMAAWSDVSLVRQLAVDAIAGGHPGNAHALFTLITGAEVLHMCPRSYRVSQANAAAIAAATLDLMQRVCDTKVDVSNKGCCGFMCNAFMVTGEHVR